VKKRSNGEGSIYKRKDKNGNLIRWEGSVTIGLNENGSLKRKTVTGKTQDEVKNKIKEIINRCDKGIYFELSNMMLSDWMDIWFKDYIMNFKKLYHQLLLNTLM